MTPNRRIRRDLPLALTQSGQLKHDRERGIEATYENAALSRKPGGAGSHWHAAPSRKAAAQNVTDLPEGNVTNHAEGNVTGMTLALEVAAAAVSGQAPDTTVSAYRLPGHCPRSQGESRKR